jgi:two-component sensor histidine kinase/PAS domain-containing protein
MSQYHSANPNKSAEQPPLSTELLAQQLADMTRLHELTTRLIENQDPLPVLEEVLQAVIDLQNADCGVFMLYDAACDDLHPAVSIGLSDDYLHLLDRVPPGLGGNDTALLQRRPVIVEDVCAEPLYTSHPEVAEQGGYRALYSTPLLNPTGDVLGTITVYFVGPHRPTDREMRLVELYARHAAGAVERTRLWSSAQKEIAERKKAEEERDYVMASARCLIWFAEITEEGHPDYLGWDMRFPDMDAAQRFLPLPLQEGESYKDAIYRCRQPEDRDRCDRLGTASVRAGRSYEQDFRCLCADGAVRWLHEDVRVETIVPGMRWQAVGVCTDITDRKQSEKLLEEKNSEIVLLNTRLTRSLAETHHRVKNNLQTIAALLDLQISDADDSISLDQLGQLGKHVRGLATIHDLLTAEAKEGGVAESVSAVETMEKLLAMLAPSLGSRHFHATLDEIRLPARHATGLALIVNELVANAVKHGRGDINVSLTAAGEGVRLKVSDSGPGFPTGFDSKRSANMGLELVQSLGTWDLQGSVTFENRPEGGAIVTVLFRLSNPTD